MRDVDVWRCLRARRPGADSTSRERGRERVRGQSVCAHDAEACADMRQLMWTLRAGLGSRQSHEMSVPGREPPRALGLVLLYMKMARARSQEIYKVCGAKLFGVREQRVRREQTSRQLYNNNLRTSINPRSPSQSRDANPDNPHDVHSRALSLSLSEIEVQRVGDGRRE